MVLNLEQPGHRANFFSITTELQTIIKELDTAPSKTPSDQHANMKHAQRHLLLIGSTIRCVGFFSKAIRQFLSLEQLLLMFDQLISLCE